MLILSSADDFTISYSSPHSPGAFAFLMSFTFMSLMAHINWVISTSLGKAFTSLTNFD